LAAVRHPLPPNAGDLENEMATCGSIALVINATLC